MNDRSESVEFSVISPVYLGARMVEDLVSEIRVNLTTGGVKSFEIILVDDGSPDDSWKEIERICGHHKELVGIKLTRNFGQHYAISAGLRVARGDFVAVMDCDLQDDPRFLCEILSKLKRGAPVVFARKQRREHSWFKNCGARFFNAIFNRLVTSKDLYGDGRIGSFSGMNRVVVNEFNKIKDAHRHYLMVVRWLGFPISYVDVAHRSRRQGRSSYSIGKLFRHALDGIISQSSRVLGFFVIGGFLVSFIAVLATVVLFYLYFMFGFKEGWASIVALMLLSAGCIIFALGVVGLYVGQTLEQARGRPLYVIEKKIGMHDQ